MRNILILLQHILRYLSSLPLALIVLDIKNTHYCLFELKLAASPVCVNFNLSIVLFMNILRKRIQLLISLGTNLICF